ncbi:MAG: hypothetical protein EBS74_05955 [Flavobacteriia bacterium]|nr:hypothetical protein [Flavobacteriia bacterium]
MSSIKLFKKEINNTIGAFIEEVYFWELDHPEADPKKTDSLVDKAIGLFDDLIDKIHQAKRAGGASGFKPLREQLDKTLNDLQEELNKMG